MEENKNEVYAEVDIESETCEECEVINVELEPEFSDEEIDEMVVTLKNELKSNNYQCNDKTKEIAKKIAINSKEYLDNDTYLWTLYTYALKYHSEGNVNAERYCYIRMKDVLNAMNKKRPYQKALTFVQSDLPEFVIAKVFDDTKFMDEEIKGLASQFIKLEIGLGAVFFALIKFIFKYSWIVSFGMIVLMLIINYKVSYKSIVNRYISEQTKACQDFCKEEELIKFDLPVYNS